MIKAVDGSSRRRVNSKGLLKILALSVFAMAPDMSAADATPPSTASQVKQAYTGTWYVRSRRKESWDGKRFGINSGREMVCKFCCIENYVVTSRLILRPGPGTSNNMIAGSFHTNYVVETAFRVDPEKQVDFAFWHIECGPSPLISRQRGFTKGSITGAYIGGEQGAINMEWVNDFPEDFDDTVKAYIVRPGVLMATVEYYNEELLYRRSP